MRREAAAKQDFTRRTRCCTSGDDSPRCRNDDCYHMGDADPRTCRSRWALRSNRPGGSYRASGTIGSDGSIRPRGSVGSRGPVGTISTRITHVTHVTHSSGWARGTRRTGLAFATDESQSKNEC